MRKRIRSIGKDKKIFRRTAVRTKKVNLAVAVPRGGIRL